MIKINFEKTLNGYTLRDTLILKDDHNLTEEQIELMKQQRFDNWYNIITSPPPADELVTEIAVDTAIEPPAVIDVPVDVPIEEPVPVDTPIEPPTDTTVI